MMIVVMNNQCLTTDAFCSIVNYMYFQTTSLYYHVLNGFYVRFSTYHWHWIAPNYATFYKVD